jgi:L-iditol 2-dehydrogenase
MRAAFLRGVSSFIVEDVAEPTAPIDGLVLRVEACGVCGSDIRRWKEGPLPGGEDLVPGHEVAGVVESVGPRLSGFSPGERLAVAPDVHCGRCYYCRRGLYNLCDDLRLIGITPGYSGGFAEKMILTQEMLSLGIVHPVPSGMTALQAALAEPCSSVLACHAKAGTSLSDTVLVMGAGPIGCIHIVVAKARGARVILSEPSPYRRQIAQTFAPDLVLDPSQGDILPEVKDFTHGLGVDIAICANPVAATQAQAVEAVRKGGRVVFFGGLPKTNPLTSLDANRIHYGEITVIGSFSYHPVFHEQALDAIHRGLIPADRLITHTFPLDQIDAAFEASTSGEALKVMITFHR